MTLSHVTYEIFYKNKPMFSFEKDHLPTYSPSKIFRTWGKRVKPVERIWPCITERPRSDHCLCHLLVLWVERDYLNSLSPHLGLHGGSDGKEYTCTAEDQVLIPGPERSPGEGDSNLFQYSCLENDMMCPWGHKELDMAEQLMLYFTFSLLIFYLL